MGRAEGSRKFLAFYKKDTQSATAFLRQSMKLNISEFHKYSKNSFVIQNELLNGFMTLPKTRKADVLNFLAKFT